MRIREGLSACALVVALTVTGLGAPVRVTAQTAAESQRHVVSLDELNQDAAQPSQARHANEAAVRDLLKTEEGQEALRRAKVDYERVDKAIGQLSDEDLAKVASRSREAQADFAGGAIGSTLLIVVILIIVLAIALAVVF